MNTSETENAQLPPVPSYREDYRTGQYVPTLNGKDISPTSFDADRAFAIAKEAASKTP